MQRHVAGDAGVVDQHFHGTQVGFDLGQGSGDGIEVADVELVDGNARFVLELGGGLVIAGVIGGDGVSGFLQGNADCLADSAGAPGNQCDASHVTLP